MRLLKFQYRKTQYCNVFFKGVIKKNLDYIEIQLSKIKSKCLSGLNYISITYPRCKRSRLEDIGWFINRLLVSKPLHKCIGCNLLTSCTHKRVPKLDWLQHELVYIYNTYPPICPIMFTIDCWLVSNLQRGQPLHM